MALLLLPALKWAAGRCFLVWSGTSRAPTYVTILGHCLESKSFRTFRSRSPRVVNGRVKNQIGHAKE